MLNEGDKTEKIDRTTGVSIPTVYNIKQGLFYSDNDVGALINNLKKEERKASEKTTNSQLIRESQQKNLFYTQCGIKTKLIESDNLISQLTISRAIKKLNIAQKRSKKIFDKILTTQHSTEKKSLL
ncbi:hypothetical protein CDIK_3979 [Cucumispora dikerogammari]|nr:hypothetical protein CDIK_3979 [Cucumispora dikerogammari]